jgi:23S rRNA (adenine2503-C2)-methyltransferase
MKIVASAGHPDIAMVYVMDFDGNLIECVESVQPPKPREEKWVLMISILFGCPIACQMCDAGGFYRGKLTESEMYAQIDYLIKQRYPDGFVPSEQFKIQFARMGEPALNPAVLDLLESLPGKINAPGLMPSFSTIAPHGTDGFFERLTEIKNRLYPAGNFQFQFSIHTTDQNLRNKLIPVKKWDFQKMAAFGDRFYQPGDRKITLNFALAEQSPIQPDKLLDYFDPDRYLIKITPLNPTYQAESTGLKSYIDTAREKDNYPIFDELREAGYRVILSIGELEENRIGSNCGQYVQKHLMAQSELSAGYKYQVERTVSNPE